MNGGGPGTRTRHKNKYDGGFRAEGAEERRLTFPRENDRLASIPGQVHLPRTALQFLWVLNTYHEALIAHIMAAWLSYREYSVS